MTRRLLQLALGGAVALAPAAALACGAFYASGVEVSADQKIIVVHRAGVETYVFRPHFCGTAKDFGVILPIPATLGSNPVLADNALFDELDAFTAPEIIEVCQPSSVGCGGLGAQKGGDFGLDSGTGVNVVDRGRVGIFDYVLLQATTANAFTDWLDQNGYPRGSSGTEAYASYVAKGWYFVAFKVTADTTAPAAGQKLCGDLGPISLSFATPRPVVPARIASINGSGTWRVFTIASGQQRLDVASTNAFGSSLYFAKALRHGELGASPALTAASRDSERLTVLNVTFQTGVAADLGLEDDPNPTDFRSVVRVNKTCPGACSTGPGSGFEALLALGLLEAVRARRRTKS